MRNLCDFVRDVIERDDDAGVMAGGSYLSYASGRRNPATGGEIGCTYAGLWIWREWDGRRDKRRRDGRGGRADDSRLLPNWMPSYTIAAGPPEPIATEAHILTRFKSKLRAGQQI